MVLTLSLNLVYCVGLTATWLLKSLRTLIHSVCVCKQATLGQALCSILGAHDFKLRFLLPV